MKTYSKKQINRAGEALILKKEVLLNKQKKVLDILVESYNILDFFRSRHSFPLNIVQNALRRFACRIDKKAVISQRLKRAPSVINKLKRYPEMSLVRMQDIAGCRAVLDNIEQVKECAKNLKESRMRHVLRREDDYILNPKLSGYRSHHLVYEYVSDRNLTFNGLKIEIQLRTKLQHSWATAVETIGTFLKSSLKSSEGPDEWLYFFSLVSAVFAKKEGSPVAKNIRMEKEELLIKIKQLNKKLEVEEKLNMYRSMLKVTRKSMTKKMKYVLLALDISTRTLTLTGFQDKERATERYLEDEKKYKDNPMVNIVLVSTESVRMLTLAYPNYFLDTEYFLEQLKEICV